VSNAPIHKRGGDVQVSSSELEGLTPKERQRRVDVWTPSAEKLLRKGGNRDTNVFRALIAGRNRLGATGVSPTVFRAVLVLMLVIMVTMALMPIYQQLR
jgi:hypothetical protein